VLFQLESFGEVSRSDKDGGVDVLDVAPIAEIGHQFPDLLRSG